MRGRRDGGEPPCGRPHGDFFHLHFFFFLPSGHLLGGWFFRVHVVSCGDELCIGEQRVDGLQMFRGV